MLKVVNPYNLQEIKRIPFSTAKDVEEALEKASQLHQKNRLGLAKSLRVLVLETLAKLVERDFEKIVEDAVKEGGKPLLDTRVEINRAILGIKLAAEGVNKLDGEVIPMDCGGKDIEKSAIAIKEPIGVVVGISAFNHPFNLIIHQAIPAIVTGCPVIIKPAKATPLSCKKLTEIIYKAGLPQEWCQMILCDHNVTEKLVADTRISFMSFIGSAKIGWHLRSKLAPGARCALEHGGAAPVIVEEDADIETAIPLLLKGGYYHAGQVCVSVQRVYLHNSIVKEFSNKFLEGIAKLKVGDPLEKNTEVGPIISIKELDRLIDWVQEAKDAGAEILGGGKKLSETCMEPTLILNPPDNINVSSKEVFGPVVCLYSYDDRDEVIQRANSLPFAFQAAVFTKNIDTAFDTVRKLKANTVMVNDHTAFRVDWMPFGGHQDSGLGMGGIPQSMEDLTIKKLMVFKSDVLV